MRRLDTGTGSRRHRPRHPGLLDGACPGDRVVHPYHEIMLRPLLHREGRIYDDPALHEPRELDACGPRAGYTTRGIKLAALLTALGLLLVMMQGGVQLPFGADAADPASRAATREAGAPPAEKPGT